METYRVELIKIIFIWVCVPWSNSLGTTEPQCYSRFDYEYKVLQNLIALKESEGHLRMMIAELQKTVGELQEKSNNKRMVAFSTQLRDRADSEEIAVLKFEHVLTNTGNGYDVETGIFTASIAGLYFFSTELASPRSARSYIMLNGINVAYLFTTGVGDIWESCSESVILNLRVGDRVWVAGKGSVEGFSVFSCGEVKCYHSSFAGYLISTE